MSRSQILFGIAGKIMGNEEHLLARTALLAGEIMLVSGAEIARIDNPSYIGLLS